MSNTDRENRIIGVGGADDCDRKSPLTAGIHKNLFCFQLAYDILTFTACVVLFAVLCVKLSIYPGISFIDRLGTDKYKMLCLVMKDFNVMLACSPL